MYTVTAGEVTKEFNRKAEAVDWLARQILHVYPITSFTSVKRIANTLIDLKESAEINGVLFSASN